VIPAVMQARSLEENAPGSTARARTPSIAVVARAR
jgi:hypothetical protein